MTGEAAPDADAGAGSVRVVGTAHVSAESVAEVRTAIAEERPDVVAVELDEGRYRQLKGGTPDDIEPGDLLRGNTVFQFLAYWMLSYVQTRMGDRFDVQPGADMLEAVETAEEHGIEVALVDREIQTTIQRFWARMTLVEKLRTVSGLVFGAADPAVVGLTVGLLSGLVAGPLVGLFGGSVGITDAVLVRATGAALGALAVGYVAARVTTAVRGAGDSVESGPVAGAAVGVAAGGLLAALSLVDPLVVRYVPGLLVQVVGSLAVGLVAGLVVGLVVALVLAVTGAGEADDAELVEEIDLTDGDVVTAMMEEFRAFSPGGAAALIDERDAYIAHRLVALRETGADVVAVVGAGHREGVERYLDAPETLPPLDSLTGTTSGDRLPWGKIVGVVVSASFVGFFVLLAVAGVRRGFLLRLFAAWFVINGVFAAGLARLAGARWRSALVGGAVAWMTSVNPLLAPGWFTGYVELRHTPVNVGDVSRLNALLSDETRPLSAILSDMFDVPLFRLMVVVALTNVGSVVASLLFAAYVLPAMAADLGGVEAVTRLMVEGATESARWLWGQVV
ncbi:MAG: TraB/GumN family protein [Haloferacaceae archaeon]|jgi:pheromone shutdown protein TraB